MSIHPIDDGRRGPSRRGGRVPPHNLEAEESLLGAMLLSSDAIAAAVDTHLSADDFYKPAHGHVFDAICALYSQGEPVDPVTVSEELRRADLDDLVGGLPALLSLEAHTPATSNAARYAHIVEEHALLRRLIGVGGEITDLGYDLPEDVKATVDRAEAMVFAIAEHGVRQPATTLSHALEGALDRIEALFERGDGLTGLPTGYTDLDHMLAGLQSSALYVIGARPGQGKTALALGIATNVVKATGRPVLFFSLEMGEVELAERILSAEARVDSHRLRTGKPAENDWEKISTAISRLAELPFVIDDNALTTVMDIRAKARRTKSQYGDLGLVVVDYLQLMSSAESPENRQIEVAQMSRGLKTLARELDVPVIAMSQLSRGVEDRADKRPVLRDLRESGSIEADADVVMLLFREELYRPDTPNRGMAEVIVAKQRNGPTGTVNLAFLDRFTAFANMASAF